MIGRNTAVASSMIHRVRWLDEASHTVRLEVGWLEDGSRNGKMAKPTVRMMPAMAAPEAMRSEEHTSESSHSQISYAVFCLKKKKSHGESHQGGQHAVGALKQQRHVRIIIAGRLRPAHLLQPDVHRSRSAVGAARTTRPSLVL